MIETRESVSLSGEKGALRAKGLSSNEPQDQSTSRVSKRRGSHLARKLDQQLPKAA